MPSPTSPRIPLERAQYFLARAERLNATERREFDNDLQAAVVFGRSAYHYLQSLAAPANADAGYRAWFRFKWTTLAADPVLEYFRRERDLTLKERSKGVQRRVSLTGRAELHVSSYAEMVVIRGAPWYRRSPSIVWQDTWAMITRPLQRWRHGIAEDLKRRRRNLRGRVSAWQARRRAAREVRSVLEFYFVDVDPEGKDRSAVDLVREYLTRLEGVVLEADAAFPVVVG